MKHTAYLSGALILCVILIVFLLFRIRRLESQVPDLGGSGGAGLAALRDSLERVQADVKIVRDMAPGLGEYMTTIQLHAGKLWFAAKAGNWPLAEYELDELEETMEAAKN